MILKAGPRSRLAAQRRAPARPVVMFAKPPTTRADPQGQLASGQVDLHVSQGNPLRRDRNALSRGGVGNRHRTRHTAAGLEADLAATHLAGGISLRVVSALLPAAGDATST
jgi:hypothetical protein